MMKRFVKNESGIAATEFALMAPVLLFMLLGLFDYGMYINTTLKIENTAFAIGQYIRAGGLEGNIDDDILVGGNLGLTEDNIDSVTVGVSYDFACFDPDVDADAQTDCGTGDYLRQYVTVSVTMDFETLIPYPGLFDSETLTRTVRFQNN